jgi:sulfur carrier protein
MHVISNGNDIDISENSTLQAYLQNEGLLGKMGIAVALNDTVIPKNEWSETQLKQGDSIIIIKATQGG